MQFDLILADPPWKYNQRKYPGTRFGLGAFGKYPLMETKNIMTLPVKPLAADPSVLFLWATWPKLPDAMAVIDKWGFEYKTLGFLWVKLNPRRAREPRRHLLPHLYSAGVIHFLEWLAFFGVGFYAKSNTEPCLLATRGDPPLHPVTNKVSQLVFAPRGQHSAKPLEVHRRIKELFGDTRTGLELFARQAAAGWTVAGNEVDKLDITQSLRQLTSIRVPNT